MDRPTKTVADVLALPEGNAFRTEQIIVNTPKLAEEYAMPIGTIIHIPVHCKASATLYERDDIFICFDEDGQGWRPVCFDGVWHKERAYLP